MDAVNTNDSTVQVKCQRCPLTLQLSSQLQLTFYSSHIIKHHDEKALWTVGLEIHVYSTRPKGNQEKFESCCICHIGRCHGAP